jgi:hypothetical protein
MSFFIENSGNENIEVWKKRLTKVLYLLKNIKNNIYIRLSHVPGYFRVIHIRENGPVRTGIAFKGGEEKRESVSIKNKWMNLLKHKGRDCT